MNISESTKTKEDHNDSIEIEGCPHVRYYKETYDEGKMIIESDEFHNWIDQRRTVRDFSDKSIPKEVIDNISTQ